jgi:4-hydroxybenzoate polyprenyltransferase
MLYSSNKIIGRVENELVFGGHIVSLISPALILTVCLLQDLPLNIEILIIAYIIPLIVYSYNYQNETEKVINIGSNKYNFVSKRKTIFPILLGLDILILSILIINLFNYGFLVFTLIIISGGILYTIIFKVLTKYIFCFKNIYVSAIWAYAGTFFILFYQSLDFSLFYLVIFVYIFIKIFINNVFFDIKDIDSDKGKNLITIPVKLGKNNTIYLLHMFNIFSIILLIAVIYYNILPIYALSLLITNVYVFIYLEKGRISSYKGLLKYTYIMADSEFIFWPILLIISKLLFYH